MTKRVTVTIRMVWIGVGLVLGLLLAGPADAQTTLSPSLPVETSYGNQNIYIVGLDGAMWYTSMDPGGMNQHVKTGNGPTANPFDNALTVEAGCPLCTGFVDVMSLMTACDATGDTCTGIWVKFPGPGSFKSPPVATASPCTNSHNITAVGLSNTLWMTLFDANQFGTATSMDPGCPSGSPFWSAGEAQSSGGATGTGFVKMIAVSVQLLRCSGGGASCDLVRSADAALPPARIP